MAASSFDGKDEGAYEAGKTVFAGQCPGDPPMGSPCSFGTEHVSLVPYLDVSDPAKPQLKHPHNVSVCDIHFRDQYLAKYGGYPEDMPEGPRTPPPRPLAPRPGTAAYNKFMAEREGKLQTPARSKELVHG